MPGKSQPSFLLQHLATLYLGLAQLADNELDEAEVRTVGDRLLEWERAVPRESVLTAVNDALKQISGEAPLCIVSESIRLLGQWADARAKRRILDDLVDIALADHCFKHSEAAFIGRVAAEWDVHPRVDNEFWTVLPGRRRNAGWSILHDLALIYTTLAYQPDGHLDHREVEAVIRKISEWAPDLTTKDIEQVVRETLATYAAQLDRPLIDDAVEAITRYVPKHQRQMILSDLYFVAHADGTMKPGERVLIEQLAQAWKLIPTRKPVPLAS
jgi:uncharacterized tellurite resistance protein B-like protein